MRSYRYRTVTVDVEVDLDDIPDEDIRAEYIERNLSNGYGTSDIEVLVRTIYEKRRLGSECNQELDDLIYSVIGRVV